jgi:hypothetical protein
MAEPEKHHGLGGGWIFLIIVIIFVALGGLLAFLYFRLIRNKRNAVRDTGFPPSSSPGGLAGITSFFKNTFQSLKNPRSTTGSGYEGAGYAGVGGSRGTGRAAHGGPLDPDEAWDSRVGNEADIYGPGGYYEETELGLHPQSTAYSGAAYGGSAAGFAPAPGLAGAERGKSRSPGPVAAENPFGDDAASSLRSVSPRPFDGRKLDAVPRDSSPTGRRSMFREDMS